MASALLLHNQSIYEPGGHMKNKRVLAPLLLSAFLLVTACSHKKDQKKEEQPVQATASVETDVTQEQVNMITDIWPQASQEAIKSLTSKYGLPDSISEEMVVWNDTAPFKRSVVFREQVNHMFPSQHADILQQTVSYRVPLDKIYLLSKLDGSLLIDRTKGELSSRNEKEEMNILALNLADKIVRGEMTVEDARREYSKNFEAFAAGRGSPMITSLNFQSRGNTQDPDTMIQSQEAKDQKNLRESQEERQRRSVEEVDVIIIDQSEAASGTRKSGQRQMQEDKSEEQRSEEKSQDELFE